MRAEIHGYVAGSDGERIEVVWVSGSGGRRRRVFAAEVVFVPSTARPWAGIVIPAEQIPFSKSVRAAAAVYK